MTNRNFADPRATEQRNPRTQQIDTASSLEIVDLMNGEDATVAGVVRGERDKIARAIDLVVEVFRGGGRLIYVGAGIGPARRARRPSAHDLKRAAGARYGDRGDTPRCEGVGGPGTINAGMASMDTAGVTKSDVVMGIAASARRHTSAGPWAAQTIGARTIFLPFDASQSPRRNVRRRHQSVVGPEV
jgi:N-acetylmuramic acid 6-phosphate etherase